MTEQDACAVVVTYEPDVGIQTRLERIAEQFRLVIVVDNASSQPKKQPLTTLANEGTVTLLENASNLGVAGALNQGLTAAMEHGYAWTVTFDQDSEPEPGLAQELLRELSRHDPMMVALVGPRVLGRSVKEHETKWLAPHPVVSLAFRRLGCADKPGEVTSIITSGALTNLQVWRLLGGFDNSLFIDYVDTDYCLRAIRRGYKVLACCNAVVRHNLGSRRPVRRLGRTFTPTFHEPLRHYYIARNRIHMMRRYAVAVPHWFIADVSFWVYNTVRVLLSEDNRRAKMRAALAGTIDGLLGRTGRCRRSFT